MTNRRQFALIGSVFIVIAVALLPLRMHAQKTDRAKALGTKLMCMCGCGQVLTQCNHLNCPSSAPMLKELDAHVAKGEADDLIIQDFVQEYGEKVLSSPPSTGFNAIAWYIPGVAFVIGLGIVVMLIRLWRQRDVASQGGMATAAAAPPGPDARGSLLRDVQLERAKRQADQETED